MGGMAQTVKGVLGILSHPRIYDFFQDLVGAAAIRDRWVREFLKPFAGARILDIGCGTGDMLRFLPRPIDYLGFDTSEAYIDAARNRFGGQGRFECSRVDEFASAQAEAGKRRQAGSFDLAMAFGVLHHLDDREAATLFACARRALKPGGRLVTLDPTFLRDQGRMARYVVSHDRGRNVRYPEEYAALGGASFASIEARVLHNALRIPIDHAVLSCRA